MICQQCGARLRSDASFCESCGHPVGEEEGAVGSSESVDPGTAPRRSTERSRPTKRPRSALPGLVGAAILILVAGSGIWLMKSRDQRGHLSGPSVGLVGMGGAPSAETSTGEQDSLEDVPGDADESEEGAEGTPPPAKATSPESAAAETSAGEQDVAKESASPAGPGREDSPPSPARADGSLLKRQATKTVAHDLNGDGRPEELLLVPNGVNDEGEFFVLVVLDDRGGIIWTGPSDLDSGNPLVFGKWHHGISLPEAVGDIDEDGATELLAPAPRSDVSPTTFRVARWTGDRFIPVAASSLLESPPGSEDFRWREPDESDTTWVSTIPASDSPGRVEAVVTTYTGGDEVIRRRAILSATEEGFRVERWLEEDAQASSTPPTPPGETDEARRFLVSGSFEGGVPPGIVPAAVARDPDDPSNHVLEIGSEGYHVFDLETIPAGVRGLRATMRVKVPRSTIVPREGQLEGIRFRISCSDGRGGRGINDRILVPRPGWREMEFLWLEAGPESTSISLETTRFSGSIYVDDVEVRSAFPIFFSETAYRFAREPAQLIYQRMMDRILSTTGGNVRIGSPEEDGQGKRVEISVKRAGEESRTLVSAEVARDGDRASVVFGPEASEGDLYHLRRIDGRWAIVGIGEN